MTNAPACPAHAALAAREPVDMDNLPWKGVKMNIGHCRRW